jgi:hypothetical protein
MQRATRHRWRPDGRLAADALSVLLGMTWATCPGARSLCAISGQKSKMMLTARFGGVERPAQ